MRIETRACDMNFANYDAVIRTDRHDATLERAVAALRRQTIPPRRIIFVDSSGDAACLVRLTQLGDTVVPYPEPAFNFSVAINVGLAAATAAHVLLISSHVVLDDPRLIDEGCARAQDAAAEVVYWIPAEDSVAEAFRVDKTLFDGHNGLSNACAMLPRLTALERPFRAEVFSAEDQEWAGWFLRERQGSTLRIKHPRVLYLNPNVNVLKTINEEIAIAYFADRRWLGPHRIIERVLRAALAAIRRRPDRARMHWEIAKGLLAANFRKPVRLSKYY